MRPSLEDVPTPSKAAVARECWRECVQSCPRTSSDMYRKAAIPIKGECCRLFCTVKSSAHAGCMTSLLLQYDGRVDVKSLSFGARDLRPFAAMGLAKGVITSKPEEYLHKYTGYTNMCRGRYGLQFSASAHSLCNVPPDENGGLEHDICVNRAQGCAA